ncbi:MULTISPECIES: ABC transporter ATP-binding protein [Citrobacter]|uniref:ABC transporter ATP-binding protein n=1 Tax=Citrobacter murliniae TaxID=67829 RepID=A0ABY2PS68_9ENTR|nr:MULTISPECIES: ABC transporter ATP-binding protein [Citrobacter]KLV67251.1 spermidine/putrescine transporter subunit [Citrobacter sp. MGH106]MBJ9598919.1 ABC transporter ATP-binding protein [Citrobacter werkmanii]THE36484.1 ABC transporter ATP-binding protein [Citrobacter murliniae]
MTYAVEFDNVSRLYGDVRAVDGVSIAINDGEFFSMLGPSGSGKTTCLRLIAGFEQLSGGAIKIFGKQASDLPPWERDVNTVFQDYALFPHMSILDNVAYGLMVKGIDKKQRHAQAREALEKVALGFVYERKPSQLSGGQRQRVAIARALVNEPRVLLLDEPLGALDLKLREQMQLELKKLQQSLGITFIFVTHDQGEALSMSDRVAVFNNGRIEQVDSPRELYMRPRTPFVASFVGTSNVFDAAMSANVCGLQGMYSLRPEHIRLNDSGGEVQARGIIQAVQYQGAATRFELKLAGGEKLLVSQANLTGETLPATLSPGQQVMASWSRDVMVPLVEER